MTKLNSAEAAQLMDELIPGEPEGYWVRFLQNNRNPQRKVAYRIPFSKSHGRAWYRRDDLTSYAEWEKRRRIGGQKLTGRAAAVMNAFGVGSASGGTTGRKLEYSTSISVDPATKEPYVSFVIDEPLLVFRLELAEVKSLVTEFQEAAEACERMAD